MRTLKNVARTLCPPLYQRLSSYRFRQYFRKRHGPFQEKVLAQLYGDSLPTVLYGPFKGLLYSRGIGICGPNSPKWIGSYEEELHPFIQETLLDPPSLIIDIGSAEGYYSVLLGARLPETMVYSYERDAFSRKSQARLACLNGISNIVIKSHCSTTELRSLLSRCSGNRLIICDIEGDEAVLLNPDECPELATAHLLIEIHSTTTLSAEEAIQLFTCRFQQTHDIEFVPIMARDIRKYRALLGTMSELGLARALNESRSHSKGWFICRPHA